MSCGTVDGGIAERMGFRDGGSEGQSRVMSPKYISTPDRVRQFFSVVAMMILKQKKQNVQSIRASWGLSVEADIGETIFVL